MKLLLVSLFAFGSMSAFASSTCNQAVVQAQLDNAIIGETLNNLNAIKVRAEANGDRKLADKAVLRTMDIHTSIFNLAENTCKSL